MKKTLLFFFLLLNLSLSFSQIKITEVYFDTPFPELFYLRADWNGGISHHLGEYIELYNYTTEDLPLKGWSIADNKTRYNFPDDAVIKSESFIVVAYKDFPFTANYFPDFFPETQGKEPQIFYQDRVILRNPSEEISLNMGYLRGMKFDDVRIDFHRWGPEPTDRNRYELPIEDIDYNIDSNHWTPSGIFIRSLASPLSAVHVPATQNLEDIPLIQDLIISDLTDMTWDVYSDAILNATCTLTVPTIQSNPGGNYLDGGICFDYDQSGNYKMPNDCFSNEVNGISSVQSSEEGYTQEELDEIASKITLYPNPTSSLVNISWDESIIGKLVSVQASSVNGLHVGSLEIGTNDLSTSFDLTGQPATIYILTFQVHTGQFISKNVIKI